MRPASLETQEKEQRRGKKKVFEAISDDFDGKTLEKLDALAGLKEAFQKNLAGKTDVPVVEKRKNKGIER